jgi:oxygen-independent coproporphyrinogen-3 oxidase
VRPLAVYIHIPFCTVKCGYCDFNAYAGLDHLKGGYMAALVREIEAARPLLQGRTISSIGFGGGTPGEAPAQGIAAVISALGPVSPLGTGGPGSAEVSLEANPGTLTFPYLCALRAAGVTRLSLGAQSFDPEELAFLDRIHSPEATAASVTLARRAGFNSLGLDLIYGLPAQIMASWLRSLQRAIDLAPDHISTYALTVEEGTPLGLRVARGRVIPLDPDTVADMYEAATDLLAAAGYHQYELSNWALPGHESRHNQVYWTDGEYIAFGAGAHGYLGGERYENISHPRLYIEAVTSAVPSTTRPARTSGYVPDAPTAMADFIALRLRLIEGLDPSAFSGRFGLELEEAAGPVIDECRAAGVLEWAGGRIRLTRRGRLLHGEVATRLLAHLRRRA